ncbi:hypothetical protein SSX86_022566 [Deinandra increscens subsp. villosa]|uniref:Uncharacterized protein n=1 Tax=Deinandra increscens subsp. villosa TaxID=3103831 RepID=A0AAP0CR01_9ASTR
MKMKLLWWSLGLIIVAVLLVVLPLVLPPLPPPPPLLLLIPVLIMFVLLFLAFSPSKTDPTHPVANKSQLLTDAVFDLSPLSVSFRFVTDEALQLLELSPQDLWPWFMHLACVWEVRPYVLKAVLSQQHNGNWFHQVSLRSCEDDDDDDDGELRWILLCFYFPGGVVQATDGVAAVLCVHIVQRGAAVARCSNRGWNNGFNRRAVLLLRWPVTNMMIFNTFHKRRRSDEKTMFPAIFRWGFGLKALAVMVLLTVSLVVLPLILPPLPPPPPLLLFLPVLIMCLLVFLAFAPSELPPDDVVYSC